MIPAQLRACKSWLLWRLEPNPKPGKKPLKVPCYVDGVKRYGEQGAAHDRARLATYDEVQRVLDDDLAGKWAGLGFAMLPEWGIVGLDFDNCVTDGAVDQGVLALVGSTYSEFSPSGTGIHAFLSGDLADRKSPGFEVFHAKGFLTVTGAETPVSELAFGGELDHVNGAVSELYTAKFGGRDASITVGVRAEPRRGLSTDQIRSLLARVTPDGSYDEWIRRGMALHHETGGQGVGLVLWDEHSKQGVDYPGTAELEKHWRSFGRREAFADVTIATLESMAAPDPDMFDVVPEEPAAAGDARTVEVAMHAPAAVGAARQGIPEAQHLCTDQANANRLVNAYGKRVLVAAGRWHVWDGRRWIADDADVYRYACKLSLLIHEEAKAVRARASTGDAAAIAKAEGIAKALEAWAVKSEMKGSIEAAVGLSRKMLTVDAESLDRDPWALNCLNGTVDLRTGQVRRHNPDELITKLVGVEYRSDARCPTWERVLGEICMGSAALVEYLGRWFGYCLTGMVTEQVFVVHWGGGSNGKSTVLSLMAETMGDYASTAAPGLLMASKNERHPTEIAALMGRRMVTAHESGQGVVLREDFIKQATGDDVMTARFMREDFFSFRPTHKLQLLTNHKPQISGQDMGIWRRVQLVPYRASFGTAEQVATGTHTHIRDLDMVARLRGELAGILAWRVRGAMEWAQGGLEAPDAVRAASDAYKTEQDRIGQFVAECCETGPDLEEPLTEGMGGLYPAFVSWCRDGGVFPVSKVRFLDEIERVLGTKAVERKILQGNGRRRDVRMILGVKLLPE